MSGLVGVSQYAVASTYQNWSRDQLDGQRVNPCTQDSLMQVGVDLVQFHKIANVVQEVNAGYDREVSEHSASQLAVYAAV